MFFTGGNSSFVKRFGNNFTDHRRRNGVESREVPIAMVSLVATAVSHILSAFDQV
jgi:hypothetical protein